MSMSISSDAGSKVIGPLLQPLLVKGKILLQTAGLAAATRNATPQLSVVPFNEYSKNSKNVQSLVMT
jgi:hypothetical protein